MSPDPASPMPPARIEILGPFRVAGSDGVEVQVPRGKNTALLAYLAAESHGVDRDLLETTFWPDSSQRARRQSLRQALSTLRKILGCDPFVVGERVRLDTDLCTNDFDDFRDALWKNDGERCLELFRGAPFTDVASGISVDFEHWLDRRREAALQRLGAVAQSMGRRALEEGSEDEAMRVLRLGTRGGLSEDALRAAIYGTRTDRPSWAAATVGADGLETLAFRARPGLESLVALVVEDDAGWTCETLTDRIAALPAEGRPTLVCVPEQTNGAESEIADLLRILVALPGGAAVRQTTLDMIEHLASTPGALDEDRTRASAESALADAFDAALDEQSIVLTCRAAGIRLQPASIVARALALQGGEGASLVVHGASERELSSLPVQTLVDACRELRHVRQSVAGALGPPPVSVAAEPETGPAAPNAFAGPTRADGDDAAVAAGGAAGANGTPARSDDPAPAPATAPPALHSQVEVRAMHRDEVRTRIKHLGYLTAAAFAVGAAGLKFVTSSPPPLPPTSGPISDYDVVFCSPRSGVFQYYRWSAETGIVERVTADAAPWVTRSDGREICMGRAAQAAGGDSLYLAVQADGPDEAGGGLDWRAYPNVPSRGDLKGRVLFAGLRGFVGPHVRLPGDARVGHHDPDRGWSLLDLDARARSDLPDDIVNMDYLDGPWAVVQIAQPGGWTDLFRIHTGTGVRERLTEFPLTESWASLRGDSLLFGRGLGGDAENGGLELVLKLLDTGEEELLTDNDWNDYEVQWSPDGRHICWQSEEFGHYQSEIMIMDLRTRRTWNLSDSPGRDFGCTFTPDGRAVVYNSLRAGDEDIIIQPLEGGEAVNLTFYRGIDFLAGFVGR